MKLDPGNQDPTWMQFVLALLIVGAFGLWGALAHLLIRWKSDVSWPRTFGALMTGVFASWITLLMLWDHLLPERPQLLLALSGLAGWGGSVILNRLLTRWFPDFYDPGKHGHSIDQ